MSDRGIAIVQDYKSTKRGTGERRRGAGAGRERPRASALPFIIHIRTSYKAINISIASFYSDPTRVIIFVF